MRRPEGGLSQADGDERGRRQALKQIGAVALSGPFLGLLSSCSGGGAAAAADGGLDGGAACSLYPDETEGPYYLNLDLLRRDITEDKPGKPLAVVIRVLSASGCAPLKDIAVDIWHCDAGGV